MITKKHKIVAGLFITIGGLLNVTRMIPVFAGIEKLPEFPLKRAQQLADFIAPNYGGHLISHLMAMVGFVFLLFGVLYLVDTYKKYKYPIFTRIFAIAGIGGLTLFFLAAIVDGFVVPEALRFFIEYGDSRAPLVEITHHLAISLYSTALFLLFISIGFNSQIILHTNEFKKRLGYFGLFVGHFTAVAFLLGLFGYFWEKPLGGLFIMLSNFYWVILGVSVMRKKVVETTSTSDESAVI
ncbi:MAG: hypothetical protein ABJP45_17755 [Cyclobacteriaceae bacterium]